MSYLTPQEAADLLGVATKTLAQWRTQKRGPKFYHVGRLVRYRAEDINEWVESR